jgi:apolipoprotein N-acyltransferase
MPKSCNTCNQVYEPEPGFYFGAMFISYIITGTLFLILAGLALLVLKLNVNQTTFLVLGVGALFFVFFFRISRVLWIHFIVKYDQEILNKINSSESGS